jgi:hypothetical protein
LLTIPRHTKPQIKKEEMFHCTVRRSEKSKIVLKHDLALAQLLSFLRNGGYVLSTIVYPKFSTKLEKYQTMTNARFRDKYDIIIIFSMAAMKVSFANIKPPELVGNYFYW